MSTSSWQTILIGGYVSLFAATICGLFLLQIKRRKDRAPLQFKLLRGPGETLRRRSKDFDENLVFYLLGASLVPVLAGTSILMGLAQIAPKMSLVTGLMIVAVIAIALAVVAVRWVVKRMMRWRDDQLGYLGERQVAEHLVVLVMRGHYVFHDVPAEGQKSDFNLDHVTVGPTGVAVVETKTRRKGRTRPGFKEHVVTYDGRQLIWPWGEDSFALEQAVAESEWLRRFILQRTGIDTPVKAILALPGWWVEAKARGTVTVVNAKNVASAVEGYGKVILSPTQIDLIVRQLDERCRDVED